MKKMQKISAIIIATVTILSTNVTNIYAKGWEKTENGDKYQLSNGKNAANGLYNIGGTVYKFDKDGISMGKYSGWAKKDGVRRYYKDGAPYTGWLKNSKDQRRYVLDGWLVTDNIQIGDTHYIFNDDGYLSGQQKLAVSADCGTVTTADDHITVKLTMLADGHESFGALSSLERWENGKWVESGLGEIPVTMELHSLAKEGDTEELTLYLHDFKLTKGIYRIPINNNADSVGVFSLDGTPIANADPDVEHVSTYAMFEVKE